MSNEQRALLATALSIGFLLAWQYYFAPRPPERTPPSAAAAGAAAQGEAAPVVPGPGARSGAEPTGGAGAQVQPAAAGERERILLVESAAARVKLTTAGARVLSWRLLRYLDAEGHPLELVPDAGARPEALPLQMVVPGDAPRTRRLNEAIYECSGPRRVPGGQEVACRWSDGRSESIEKTLTLPDDGYLAALTLRTAARGGPPPLLAWAPGLIRDEGPGRYGQPARGVHLSLGNGAKVERLTAGKAGEWAPAPGRPRWAAVEGHYFAAVIVPEEAPAAFALYGRERDAERPEAVGVAWAPAAGGAAARLYVGPKSYDELRALERELEVGLPRLIDFGYFDFVAVPLFLALKWLYRHLHSYGLAIVLLTVVIKLVFYPITQRSMVKMRQLQKQMKKLQPKLQHLKEQYARKPKNIENRQRMNQEMMEIYKREGVNPMASMSGCLPLLLQIPILWALYNLLSAAIELRRAPFLYLEDLSAPDPYFIAPVVMGATMWIQQRMSGTAVPDAAQRFMLNLMPWIMTFLFKDFPSGLVLYWLVNNILGIGQQYLINRQADATETPAGRERAGARRA